MTARTLEKHLAAIATGHLNENQIIAIKSVLNNNGTYTQRVLIDALQKRNHHDQ